MAGTDTEKTKMPTVRDGISDSIELQNLLFAISEAYPMVISVNLSKNRYKMLEYEKYITRGSPEAGVFDDLINVGATTVHPVHRQKFIDTFCREGLLKAFAAGAKKVELDLQQQDDNGEYVWIRTTVFFVVNHKNSDVLEITLAQPIKELKTRELETLRLRTVLEMAMFVNFEYICVVNVHSGRYELFANDIENTHRMHQKGRYDQAIIHIRDTLIPEEERDAYFENAKLSNVIARLNGSRTPYQFRYRLNDTPEQRWREAMFRYSNPDRDELLLTVHDVHGEVLAENAKRTEEMQRRNKETQRLLTELGFDIIIDIDLVSSHAELLVDSNSFLKRKIICEHFPHGEILAGNIYPDDIGALTAAFRSMENAASFSVDFRLKEGTGAFLWCRCKAVYLHDETGKPSRCICKLTDIDEQKKTEQSLLYKAERDSLTALYNNKTTEKLIDDYFAGEGSASRHGLLVIDIDNFKKVNDSYGHQSGDKLLQYLANTLHSSFRSSDIVGRIGGDEFVVLLKNIKSPSDAIDAANTLRGRIKPLTLEESGVGYTPVCSIGIALFPDHGATYAAIFPKADSALYEIKASEKGNVKLQGRTNKK